MRSSECRNPPPEGSSLPPPPAALEVDLLRRELSKYKRLYCEALALAKTPNS